eukprot:COSAG05_NODE_280_length_12288_cov_4.797933_8_plen_317_part_00
MAGVTKCSCLACTHVQQPPVMRYSSLRLLFFLLFAVHTAEASLACDRDSTLGLTEIAWHSEKSHIYLGSPSVLRLGPSELIATADRFGKGFDTARNVSLYRSTDNGTSWDFHTWIAGMYWANLFRHGGKIFLLGTDQDGKANIKISASADGRSWPSTQQATLVNGSFQTGPTPTVLAGGRLYRAMERLRAPYRWGVDYEAVVVHASSDSDLLQPASWTITASLPFDTKWLPPAWGAAPFLLPLSRSLSRGSMSCCACVRVCRQAPTARLSRGERRGRAGRCLVRYPTLKLEAGHWEQSRQIETRPQHQHARLRQDS